MNSLRPLAECGEVDEWSPYVVSENHWFRMLRTPRYKYCCFASEDSDELLVDLVSDPGELKNLASDGAYGEVLQSHRGLMTEWMDVSNDNERRKFL